MLIHFFATISRVYQVTGIAFNWHRDFAVAAPKVYFAAAALANLLFAFISLFESTS